MFLDIRKIYKDNRFRHYFNFVEKKKYILKYCMSADNSNFNLRIVSRFFFYKNKKKIYFSQIKNRCIFTGRSRGVISYFKVSRHTFKKLANSGNISNVRKK